MTGCYLRTGILLVYLRAHTHTSLVLSNVKMDGILSTQILLVLTARCNHPRIWDIEGSHIRAPPFYPFYCGFDRERGFRVFRLAGVSVFRAFVSMSGFWET